MTILSGAKTTPTSLAKVNNIPQAGQEKALCLHRPAVKRERSF